MRPIAILLTVLFFSKIHAAEIPVSPVIREVTVYRAGAKVSSHATVRVPAGNSEVVFENLSPHFNAASLQVKIEGGAVLNAAVFRMKNPAPVPENQRVSILRDSILLVGDELTRTRDEQAVLTRESALLDQAAQRIGSTAPGSVTTVSLAEMRDLLAYYRQRELEIKERQLQLRNRERKTNELLQRLNQTLVRLQPNAANQTGEIVLKIETDAPQNLEITCTYLVTQAAWSPLYDLRSGGFDKPLRLIYKANVRNLSGFDWKNVKLHLSTATPLADNNRPILNPVYVDFRVAGIYDDGKLYRENLALSETVNIKGARDKATNYYLDGARAKQAEGKKEEDELEQQRIEQAFFEASGPDEFLTVFDLEKPQDVLADGKENVVVVDEKDMPALYEYHSVPKLDPGVFLLAKVTDYGRYSLLPGTANIFFEETFVGQAFVNPKQTSDTLLLSLGRDEQLVVKRLQPVDFTERRRIIGNSVKETYAFEITLKNNKSVPVRVNLLDQIPISKQKDIEVELLEKDGAKYLENLGSLEWYVDLPPGKSKKVKFSYSVRYPSGKAVGLGN